MQILLPATSHSVKLSSAKLHTLPPAFGKFPAGLPQGSSLVSQGTWRAQGEPNGYSSDPHPDTHIVLYYIIILLYYYIIYTILYI